MLSHSSGTMTLSPRDNSAAVTSPREQNRSPRRTAQDGKFNKKAVPIVRLESSLSQKMAKLPSIYRAPPKIGYFMPPISKTPQPRKASSSREDAAAAGVAPQPKKRLTEMDPEELAQVLRARLEESRRVPRLSKPKPVEVPPVRVAKVTHITMDSADVVVGNRQGNDFVRLMISLDSGHTYREQAVAQADVFHVDGLLPGKRYHCYVAAASSSTTTAASSADGAGGSAKVTIVHFTTQNPPVDPKTNKPTPLGQLPPLAAQRHSSSSAL